MHAHTHTYARKKKSPRCLRLLGTSLAVSMETEVKIVGMCQRRAGEPRGSDCWTWVAGWTGCAGGGGSPLSSELGEEPLSLFFLMSPLLCLNSHILTDLNTYILNMFIRSTLFHRDILCKACESKVRNKIKCYFILELKDMKMYWNPISLVFAADSGLEERLSEKHNKFFPNLLLWLDLPLQSLRVNVDNIE